MYNIIKYFFIWIISGLAFLPIGALSAYVFLNTRYVSEPWHVISLEEEFRASQSNRVSDFDEYLRLEERLFQELNDKIYMTSVGSRSDFNRYQKNSRSDSFGYPVNWNKTFELAVENPRGGVLLMHGLTDSPYSIRSLAQKLHDQGFWVVGIRLPGHGTIPAELLDIQWQDWAAAARIGARRVKERIGGESPFYMVGYSTGAAMAVEYAISVIEGEALPETDGLILLSAAVDLPKVAGLAKFQLGLSRLPGLGKLAWESVSPEYDPYKYNSFPVNAGDQVYRLAITIQERIKKLEDAGKLASFPRILAFQSIVDGTIKADGVVEKLLIHLPSEKNVLVVYDVDQRISAQGLLSQNGYNFKARLMEKETVLFRVELITNVTETQNGIRVVLRKPGQAETTWKRLPFSWPMGIYSLSHVALPFPPDDPIYGALSPDGTGFLRLGNINLKGEKNVFAIPQINLMRLRYNPFYAYMDERLLDFLGLTDDE